MDEIALLRLARVGDLEAFNRLVLQYQGLAQGDLESCVQGIQADQLSIDDELTNLNETRYVALAHILLVQDDYETALSLIERLLRRVEESGRVGRVIKMLVLRVSALAAKDAIPQALADIEQALTLAEPGGYVRTFLDEGESIIMLLQKIVRPAYRTRENSIISEYASRLLALSKTEAKAEEPAAASAVKSSAPPLLEPLSERELEVLRLIAAGHTNQQIAAELVIAIGTVKRHTANIFNKPDVYNRTEAVARARQLGVL